MSGYFFDTKENHFSGEKVLWNRFKDEIETVIRSEIGSEWADDYLFKKHPDDICRDSRFMKQELRDLFVENENVSQAQAIERREQRKEASKYNENVASCRQGIK